MRKLTGVLISSVLICSLGTTSAFAAQVTPENEIVYMLETADSEIGREDTTGQESFEDDVMADESEENGSENTDSTGDETDEPSFTEEVENGNEYTQEETLNEDPEADIEGLEIEEGDGEEENDDEEEEEDEDEEEEVESVSLRVFSIDDYVNDPIDLGSLTLKYDDRYDLSKFNGISADEKYTICMKEDEKENIESYQVTNGAKSEKKDEFLLAQKTEGSTSVIASGVGTTDVYIIRTEDLETLKELEDVQPYTENTNEVVSDDENSYADDLNAVTSNIENINTEDINVEELSTDIMDEENLNVVTLDSVEPEETIDVYKLTVTVEKAPLTLMFLAGQSNMEGYCCSSTGYEIGASVACTDGMVYSTYAPSSTGYGDKITGLSFGSACTGSNAGSFVAGSLQGNVSHTESEEDFSYIFGGTLEEPLNMSGGTLVYSLNSLTDEGSGKTGPDSGLAYEWSQETGDKVWVINTAYGSTSISAWVPGGDSSGLDCYSRSVAVWENVLKTYNAEIQAGHYTNGSVSGNKLVFWLQGETGDATLSSAADYEKSFGSMYNSMCADLGQSSVPFGIIMVRAGYAKKNYTTEEDLFMTSPRIAQYFLGSSNSSYKNVFVVSNANEQWVTDAGVKAYFKSSASSGLNYPMQNASKRLPTTVDEVHSDIHFSQIGHNENGISAAYGMLAALGNTSGSCEVTWRDEDYNAVSSLTLGNAGDFIKVVPVVEPVYLSKNVSYSISGKAISYDFSTGILMGESTGTSKITPSSGSSTLSVAVSPETDVKKINGVWTYTVNGVPDYTYTGLAKNSNGWWYVEKGVVNFNYTGFAENSNGKWYCEKSEVTFNANGVYKDTTGAIGTKGNWYYVVGSKVQTSYTGVANYKNSNGWWYIKNGQVDFNANTVAKNNNGWWYVDGGKVNFNYNGFGSNSNGKWYCENGKVTFNKNSVLKDSTGAIGTKGTWYYVVGSKVQSSYTGVANYKNSNGWWYIKNGQVDFSANTVAKNNNGWWYVLGGKVQFGFTGLANYKNANGWWYIKGGKVDFSASGVYKNNNGWWYVNGGKVDFGFNGIAKNSNGWWYIKGGKVDFSFNGTVKVSGVTYKVTNGKVDR